MKPSVSLFCLVSLLVLPSAAFSLGFRVADHNAEATARGEAFAATADNPSAIYFNPAGITQLSGTQTLLSCYAISIKERVDLDAPDDSFSSTNTELQPVPTFFVTWKPKDHPIALGLGVYAPFGFSLEYPDDTPFRNLAKEGSIQYVTINPVIAWQVCDTLSVAAGPTVNLAKAKLTRGVIAPGDYFDFEGQGVSYGFTAGILWHPHPMHHFGLTYRSGSKIDFSGHASLNTDPFTVATPFGPFTVPGIDLNEDANGEIQFPQTITFGYSFRPTENWNFEFNIDWTDWDSLNTVTLKKPSGDVALPFNYESSFFYEFGITRKLPANLQVSVGYIYSENSVPDESFNPIVPDSNRHIFSGGISQRFEHFNWALAYQYTVGPERTISQGTIADGDYRMEGHAAILSLGYNF